MGKCPSQGPQLELVHVLLAKQQWRREDVVRPGPGPGDMLKWRFCPWSTLLSVTKEQVILVVNPWVHELFLHCDPCSLTRSVCGRPVSGRTRVGGCADSWWIFSCFLPHLLVIVSAVRSLFSQSRIVLPDKKSCAQCWLQFAVSS